MKPYTEIKEEYESLTDQEIIEALEDKRQKAVDQRDEAIEMMRSALSTLDKLRHSLHVVGGHAMLIAGEVQKANSFNH